MDFGEILTRSWQITWKHKILWLFGFLAALGSGSGNSGSSNSNNSGGGSSFSFPNSGEFAQSFQRLWDRMDIWMPILILLMLVLALVIIVLSTYGRIGLARGAWLADEGQDRLALGELWGYGTRYFWRAIAMVLILVAIAIAILLPTVFATAITGGLALVCLFPLLCVLGIGLVLLGVLFDLAIISIVNEDLGVMEGIQRAWNLCKTNVAQIIGMALILWLISVVIGFGLALPMLLIALPIFVGMLSQTQAVFNGSLIISVVLFLFYLPILMTGQGILHSYAGSAWVLVYRRLSGRAALAG